MQRAASRTARSPSLGNPCPKVIARGVLVSTGVTPPTLRPCCALSHGGLCSLPLLTLCAGRGPEGQDEVIAGRPESEH